MLQAGGFGWERSKRSARLASAEGSVKLRNSFQVGIDESKDLESSCKVPGSSSSCRTEAAMKARDSEHP
jgi:hypothetical protein